MSARVDHSQPHESALGHVTGDARYIDDIPTPANTLHVAVGSADTICGAITRCDLSVVRRAPGVIDVVTAGDVPGKLDIGAVYPGDPLLADGTVEYASQPVFAVAATSLRLAQQAVKLAQIELDERPAQLSSAVAIEKEGFVLPTRTWRHADTEESKPVTSIDGTLTIRGQEHFYLEGQAALVIPEEHGALRVHSSTQHPDDVQHQVADVLGLAMHNVRVLTRRMGGGFGGKETQAAPVACLAALFAQRTGRCVKYRMPRHDDMVMTGKRHDFDASYSVSCDEDGLLTNVEMELAGKCGFSPDLSEGIVDRAMFHAMNGYYTPKAEITGYRCRTNTVSHTAFRGFGGPQGMLTIEAAMDELAFKTGIDPLELRLRNLYSPGRDTTPYGQKVEQHILAKIMNRLATNCDYRNRQEGARAFNAASKNLKKGLALTPVQFGISFTATHLNQAGALLNVFRDGSVEINHAGTEMGQGLFTKVQQVVSRALGLPLHAIVLGATQTDKVPNGSPTAASSGSDLNGMAALDACEQLKQRLTSFAHSELGWPSDEELTFAGGSVSCGGESMQFEELIKAAYLARVQLSVAGFYKTPDIHFDKEAGKGSPFFYYANGAAASEVIIDTMTGEYRLLRTDILHDVGDSLNPAVDLGQIEGGFIQGLGWLTTEELLWDDAGRLISNSPANYKIPTADNCPEHFNVEMFDTPNPRPTIYRSKAVGEPPLMLAISAWCALRNAACAAGDYHFLPTLAAPATPEQVYWAAQQAMQHKGNTS